MTRMRRNGIKTQDLRLRWVRIVGLVRRLVLAAWYAFRLLVSFFVLRRKLNRRFGPAWVARNIPDYRLQRVVQATWKMLATAAQPAAIARLERQNSRLQQVLSQLYSIRRTLNTQRKATRISTEPGLRVWRAAMARCLSSFCGRPVEPAELEFVVANSGLIETLIGWLENHGVQTRLATPSPWIGFGNSQSIGDRSLQDSARESPYRDFQQTLAAYRLREIEYLSEIAERELFGVWIESCFQLLAIPTALIHADEKRDFSHRRETPLTLSRNLSSDLVEPMTISHRRETPLTLSHNPKKPR